MAFDYQTAVARLYALGHELHRTPAHKFDLAHMRVLLAELGEPQQQFRSVLVAGTNGKGSTAATLASILQRAGHRTALYTSPHLVRINERIRVDGEEIACEHFAAAYDQVEAAVERLIAAGRLPWHPSFFESLTAMAFLHFVHAGAEIAVLEVGMGGRLDATNVVEPVLSIITDISLDHQKFLGNTIAEIAAEKAGIIRPCGVVITLPQHPQANDVIGKVTLERGAQAISAVPYVPPVSSGAAAVWNPGTAAPGRNRYSLNVMGKEIEVDSPLVGRHQLRNVALAIAAAVQLNDSQIRITPEHIAQGIRETCWPGRFQFLAAQGGRPDILLDVAHNPAGAWALRAAISERFEGRRLTLLFGVLRDKAIAEIADILFPIADRVVATKVDNPRSATPEEIAEAAARTCAELICEPEFAQAFRRAIELTPERGLLVVTGSIYLVAEALRILQDATKACR